MSEIDKTLWKNYKKNARNQNRWTLMLLVTMCASGKHLLRIITFVSRCSFPAQPVLWQLPFACRSSSEHHELQQQHFLEHGQTLFHDDGSCKVCQVSSFHGHFPHLLLSVLTAHISLMLGGQLKLAQTKFTCETKLGAVWMPLTMIVQQGLTNHCKVITASLHSVQCWRLSEDLAAVSHPHRHNFVSVLGHLCLETMGFHLWQLE